MTVNAFECVAYCKLLCTHKQVIIEWKEANVSKLCMDMYCVCVNDWIEWKSLLFEHDVRKCEKWIDLNVIRLRTKIGRCVTEKVIADHLLQSKFCFFSVIFKWHDLCAFLHSYKLSRAMSSQNEHRMTIDHLDAPHIAAEWNYDIEQSPSDCNHLPTVNWQIFNLQLVRLLEQRTSYICILNNNHWQIIK